MYIFKLGDEADSWMSETANLCNLIQKNWSVTQYRIFNLYLKYNLQQEVAAKLGITQQAVSDSLKAANYKELISSFKLIDSYLK